MLSKSRQTSITKQKKKRKKKFKVGDRIALIVGLKKWPAVIVEDRWLMELADANSRVFDKPV